MDFNINWILDKKNDLFTLFYQKGIELLWSKSYEDAKKSFLLCKSICESVISYEKVCKEILNLALSTTELLLLEKDTNEITLSIKLAAKALLNEFPSFSNLIFYEISRIYTSIENYIKAIKYTLESLKNIHEEQKKYYIWTFLGFLYQCSLDFEKSKIYYDKCENSLNSNLIDPRDDYKIWCLNIAEFYIIKGEYEKAIEKYILGLSLCNEPWNYKIYVNFYFKLGEAFNFINDYGKSRQYYFKAKKLAQDRDSFYLIRIYLKLSEFYLKNFELAKALKMAKSCKRLCKNFMFNEKINFAVIYRILGIIKFHQCNFEKCELYFQRSLKLCEEKSFNWISFIIELNVLELYVLSNNFIISRKHLQRLNGKFEKLRSKNYNSFLYYDILSKFYVLSYDFDKVNTIIDIWQQSRNIVLEYDTNEKCEIYCLNALKYLDLNDYEESETWLMKWKIFLTSKKFLNKSQYFKFSSILGWLYLLSNKISKTIEVFLENSKYFESCLKYDSPKLGSLYIYLSCAYSAGLEQEKALTYLERALYIFEMKCQSKEILFHLYNNFGALDYTINDKDIQNYFLRAKELFNTKKLINYKWIFEFHLNQALHWIRNENYEESRMWLNNSKKFAYNKITHPVQIGFIEALTWIHESNYQKAKRILIKGITRLKNYDSQSFFMFDKLYRAIAICYKLLNKISKYRNIGKNMKNIQ